jgi:hypothetical protein
MVVAMSMPSTREDRTARQRQRQSQEQEHPIHGQAAYTPRAP